MTSVQTRRVVRMDVMDESSPSMILDQSATLVLEDGTEFHGYAFGDVKPAAGETVFCTGMVGYPETLTDPSFAGQMITCTYPLVGNYGVPAERMEHGMSAVFESDRIHAEALIVADYSPRFSHWDAGRSLGSWLKEQGVLGVTGIDTRALTKRLREKGSMLGVIEVGGRRPEFHDPNKENLIAKVSTREPMRYGKGTKRVALIDCGTKFNIIRSMVGRGVEVLRVPWDYELKDEQFDGLIISNGPGDPSMAEASVQQIRNVMARGIPVFGVCMGHQLLALAIGARTYKLKYGHRGQNQPVVECGTDRCFVTSQNHGFAVDATTLPPDWRPWFSNLNDGTSEGIRHSYLPFRSVQFHPEACPGPVDTGFLFDEFVRMIGQ